MDEGQSRGGVEEGSEDRIVRERLLPLRPKLQGRTGQLVLACKLSLRGAGRALLLSKVVQVGGISAAAVIVKIAFTSMKVLMTDPSKLDRHFWIFTGAH